MAQGKKRVNIGAFQRQKTAQSASSFIGDCNPSYAYLGVSPIELSEVDFQVNMGFDPQSNSRSNSSVFLRMPRFCWHACANPIAETELIWGTLEIITCIFLFRQFALIKLAQCKKGEDYQILVLFKLEQDSWKLLPFTKVAYISIVVGLMNAYTPWTLLFSVQQQDK